jgi:Zn-dependent metalloprotease
VRDTRRYARLGVVLVLLVLATTISGAASGGSTKNGKGVDPALLQKLKEHARGSVTISTKAGTEAASFVKAGQNGDLLPGDSAATAHGKSNDFLAEYGALLGVSDAGQELVSSSASVDALGSTHITYRQVYNGVPVFGGIVKTHVDKAGDLTAVNGVFVPDVSVDTTPRLSAAQAVERAIAAVVADPPADESGAVARIGAGDLSGAAKLYVYRLGLVRGVQGSNQLVYEVEVTGAGIRDFVFVHAQVGKIVNRYSAGSDALYRRVFEQHFTPATQVWQEGDPFPGLLNVDQQNIVNHSGQAYYLFSGAFGRDSYDAAGHVMNTVNNDPTINCPNANWNGLTTNYCNGVTSDDVVAHEWGHAYTQFTDDLIYQWQPGALNESYSDIWGETVDQLNGTGTDTPGGIRAVSSCSTHTTPIPILLINSPASIAGTCAAGAASFGPPLTGTGTTGNAAIFDDGVADPSTTNGCTPAVSSLAGKIAIVDRGVCAFTIKVKNAQNAGAIGVVVVNSANSVAGMGGGDATITIPSLLIALGNGTTIKNALGAGNTVSLTLKTKGGTNPPQDNVKWLMGEDSTAFNPTAGPGNHAIRDMWEPTCLSDPGKVSDAEYQCDTSDGGGVHTNSGVPNHGCALLVDGGMYNGQTVTGIGLTKAAAIYWRAQSVYQTKTTDFADHADALEASCADLIGKPINELSTTSTPGGVSSQVIGPADCASVTTMIAAVELRRDPTAQCNFQPLLNQTTPGLCANQKNPPVIYEEDFEDGLTGWTVANAGVFPVGWEPATDWVATSALPPGHSGSAAYAVDRDGQCGVPTGDRSGVMSLASPAITLPSAGILSPRATFEHSIASELNFDGGNVKISINGGAYVIVPKSAFIFNGYNTTMTTAAGGNTSPLAGQPGFSGSDGGQVTTKWGESQIDLTKVGAKPGDTIQLRFDFGMDGCGSIDGWYVDNVQIRACNTKKDEKAKQD